MSDGKKRCFGEGDGKEFYREYHDREWGIPVHDDKHLFEMLILEGAQAGLSWETVLKKRVGYQKAFHRFNPAKVAAMTDEELESIDLVMLDLKTWNPERHRRLTGMDVAPVLEFARRLAARGRPVWLRYVLVPGLTDDAQDITPIARFAAGLDNVERVDVLPFHQMGRFKWKELKLNYVLEKVAPPTTELIERVCGQFRAEGLNTY